ncbi:neural cell adhesion molecule 1-like [Glandiceps talaboti]
MMYLKTTFTAALFLLTATIITEAEVDILIIPSYDQYKAVNDTLSLNCEVLDGQNPQWIAPNGNTILDLTQPGFDPKLYVQKMGIYEATLWFEKITATHGGVYRCEAEGVSDDVEITIIQDIKFVNSPTPQHLIKGEDGFIHCEVTSNPPATLHWKYNGDHLAEDNHYVFESNGLKINDVTLVDEGIYNCRARVKETGAVESVDIQVFVYELPTFIQVPENTSNVERNSAQFRCDAIGMPDPNLKWKFGGEEITASEKYSITTDSTVLTILNLDKDDQGTYTCLAENPIADIEASAFLLVHTFPKVGPSQNKTAEEGTDVFFGCTVIDGSPTPELKWKWNNEELYYGSQPSNPRMEIDERDGVLLLYITGVTSDEVGIYTCEATNYAGRDSKDYYLNVEHAPYIDTTLTPSTVRSWIGNTVDLHCVVIGFPQPTIEWEHYGKTLTNATFREIGFNTYRSTITVTSQENNFGDYMCKGENKIDTVEYTIILEQTYVPEAPSKIDVLSTGPTSVTFIIHEPENHGGWPIEYCKVFVTEGIDGAGRERQQIFEGVGVEVTFSGLEGGLEYTMKVQCSNKVGYSELSEPPILFTTKSYSKPQSPMVISPAKSDSQNSYTLEWMPGDDGGKEITSYTFTYGENTVSDKSLWKLINDIPPTTTEYEITKLKPNTGYRIELRAVNDVGTSDQATIDILTAEGKNSGDPQYDNRDAAFMSKACTSLILLCVLCAFNIFRT